jgi:hypothetical protein
MTAGFVMPGGEDESSTGHRFVMPSEKPKPPDGE